MPLTDAGFDYSVLCEFRQRLLDHDAAQQLLDVMLKRFAERGWLKTRSKQHTDSTHILAAIRQLNHLELVHETLRYTLNELAVEAPAWLNRSLSAIYFKV